MTRFILSIFSLLLTFNISSAQNCSSIEFQQDVFGKIEINANLSQLSSFSKYVRFKIDDDFINATMPQHLFQTPNAMIYYYPPENNLQIIIIPNRVGCNSSGQGCVGTYRYKFSAGITRGVWHALALSVNANNGLNVILDGSSQSLSGPIYDACCSGNYNYVNIGGHQGWNSALCFNGFIDDVALWDTELSTSSLLDLTNCNSSVFTSAIAHWDLNEGSGNNIYDITGNNHHGLLVGNTSWAGGVNGCFISCTVFGCTDSLSSNYNSLATIDDGSCCYVNITQNDTSICYPASLCLEASVNHNIGSNNSLSFNGTNDYIDVGYNYNLQPDYVSIATWVKLNSNSTQGNLQYIAGESTSGGTPGYFLYSIDGKFYFCIGSGNNASVQKSVLASNDNCNATYLDDKWHYVLGTYDGNNIKIYVDGELESIEIVINGGIIYHGSSWPNGNPGGQIPFRIGALGNNGGSYFNGLISDISIFDYALSPTEVSNYYCSGLTGNESGLRAFWKMDEGSGSTLYDSGPNNVNLTINSASWDVESKPNCTFYDYTWSTGDTTASITVGPSQSTTYWVTQNGCTDSVTVTVNPIGCTDITAFNYDSNACIDDGSCIYSCGAITGVNLTDVIHDRATFNWDNMNSQNCQVDQIRFRYREVGTNSWSMKTMGVPVGSGCNTSNTSKRILNLSSSTTYEYEFKIWYCNASSITWHANGQFTTQPQCDNVINIIPTPLTNTKTRFCWDSVSTYAFVRLKYRENVPGTSFSNIGGMGVMSPTLCKDKNGITSGLQYRLMWRTWCNPSGGPYRSPVWDGPVLWTQPTSIRVEGVTAINNLEIYPNPSRDVFNITFISEDVQDLEVRVINVVGEIIYTENLQQFIGEYTKQVDLYKNAKGIYFLEITTNNGVISKKLILQ